MKEIKPYLRYSRREVRGTFVLLFVLLGIILFNVFSPVFQKRPVGDKAAFDEKLASLLTLMDSTREADSIERQNQQLPAYALHDEKQEYFPFNPNTASYDDLLKLGLKPYQAKQVINYREKVKLFRVKADFSKIYSIKTEQYQALEPYIQLPDDAPAGELTEHKPYTEQKQKVKVELNAADSAALEDVKGIGAYLASKIIRYRERLGGFYSLDQLDEIYQIKTATEDERLQKLVELKEQLTVNADLIKKIEINLATIEQMGRHPYIGFKYAKLIVNYRQQHGAFHTADDFKKIVALAEKDITRFTPYFKY